MQYSRGPRHGIYIKTFAFLPIRKGVEAQKFHDHWRHPHATWGREMRDVRRYVQNHRISTSLLGAAQDRYEGIVEAWFESIEDLQNFVKDPAYLNYLAPDEVNFIDTDGLTYLTSSDESPSESDRPRRLDDADSLWSPWVVPHCIKLFQLVLSGGNHDLEGTDDAAIAKALGALRHARFYPLDALIPPGGPPFIAIREFWPPYCLT